MSKLNHTPGPWKSHLVEAGSSKWIVVVSGEESIAQTNWWPADSVIPEEIDANAKLIAAAPEMYKLLRLAATGEQIRIAAEYLIRKLEAQDS